MTIIPISKTIPQENDIEANFFDLHQKIILPLTVTDEFKEYVDAIKLKIVPINIYNGGLNNTICRQCNNLPTIYYLY